MTATAAPAAATLTMLFHISDCLDEQIAFGQSLSAAARVIVAAFPGIDVVSAIGDLIAEDASLYEMWLSERAAA